MSKVTSLLVVTALATGAGGAPASEIEHAVEPGDRLDISNYAGAVTVHAWDRDLVRVLAEHRPGEEIRLVRRGAVIRVRADSWDQASDALELLDAERAVLRTEGPAPPGLVVYRLSVPAWLPVTVGGALTDITVADLAAPLTITAFRGNVRVSRLRGDLEVRALAAAVDVTEATGTLKIHSWQGGAALRDTRGNLTVQTTSGPISIRDHRDGGLEAVTVAGGITYAGALPRAGGVSLATHSGDLQLLLPAAADASFAVRQLRGAFASEFPTGEISAKSFEFQLGAGRSPVDLESFSGEIRLSVLGEETD